MEPFFVMRACLIGAYLGKTKGGITINEAWRENDGLVNTVSAMSPMGAPAKPYDKKQIDYLKIDLSIHAILFHSLKP